MSPKPITSRPLDLFLVAFFSISVLYGFFQAPALLAVMFGLVRLKTWLRPLGLVYAGAAVTNMFFYLVQTFLGPHPPPSTVYYLAFNLPWLFAPMVLGLRVYFGRDIPGRDIVPSAPATSAVVG